MSALILGSTGIAVLWPQRARRRRSIPWRRRLACAGCRRGPPIGGRFSCSVNRQRPRALCQGRPGFPTPGSRVKAGQPGQLEFWKTQGYTRIEVMSRNSALELCASWPRLEPRNFTSDEGSLHNSFVLKGFKMQNGRNELAKPAELLPTDDWCTRSRSRSPSVVRPW